MPTAEETTLPTVASTVVTGAEKLDVVLQILVAMEDNDIVGSIASIDVTYLDDIVLWYRHPISGKSGRRNGHCTPAEL